MDLATLKVAAASTGAAMVAGEAEIPTGVGSRKTRRRRLKDRKSIEGKSIKEFGCYWQQGNGQGEQLEGVWGPRRA